MKAPILNMADLEFGPTRAPAPERLAGKFGCTRADIGGRIGAQQLGYNITRVAPGRRAFPFHNHRVNEEMFFILEGMGELRYGKERFPLKQSDFIACPPGGPETAHQIINTSKTAELKYLALGTHALPEICDYPDSNKFAVLAEYPPAADGTPQGLRHVDRAGESLDYWDGEE